MPTTTNPAAVFAATNACVLRDCAREVSFGVSPDAMMAVAGTVSRDWGHTGYSIVLITGDVSGSLWAVHHGDGSEFRLWADRWGNVGLVPTED